MWIGRPRARQESRLRYSGECDGRIARTARITPVLQKRKGEDSLIFKPNSRCVVVATLLDTNGQHDSPRPHANIANPLGDMFR